MAYCDSCGNFDEQDRTLEESKEIESYQPDLYYYWDAPLEENYNWRDALPAADCLCEICFDILNSEGKIKWTNSTAPFLLDPDN
jgi:hypothetical protein